MMLPAAAYLNPTKRFKRFAEGERGAVLGQGGFSMVFQRYDVLTGEQFTIQRQKPDDAAASHDNLLRMKGMFIDTFKNVECMYIDTEPCTTSLWKALAVDDPEESVKLLLPHMPQYWLHGIARAGTHLHF